MVIETRNEGDGTIGTIRGDGTVGTIRGDGTVETIGVFVIVHFAMGSVNILIFLNIIIILKNKKIIFLFFNKIWEKYNIVII